VKRGDYKQSFHFSSIKSYKFKVNTLILNKNYILYLLNTPDNLLTSFCLEQIGSYYEDILRKGIEGVNIFYLKDRSKYGLVSLYHALGNRLILYCLKYMYTQYISYYKDLAVRGEVYKNIMLVHYIEI
jgi:hypothetical protein